MAEHDEWTIARATPPRHRAFAQLYDNAGELVAPIDFFVEELPERRRSAPACRASSRTWGREAGVPSLAMNRRAFLGRSAFAAGAYFLRVPKLARGDEPALPAEAVLYELTSRPANYESVRSTFTTRITPVE